MASSKAVLQVPNSNLVFNIVCLAKLPKNSTNSILLSENSLADKL